jgi:tripartite-type tricarboxylate transporter receptor subunit TctC
MQKTNLPRRAVLATVPVLLAAPAIVRAQSGWPKGSIKFVVPLPAGGSADAVARILQTKVVEATGWNILIDNKPGGGGVVGATTVAHAPPDGQTWMVTFDNHILNPAFTSPLPYRDSELFNVTQIGRTPQVIATHPGLPYKAFGDLVADARKRPGKLTVGLLTASQALVFMTLLGLDNGIDFNLIPYKGGPQFVQDLLARVTDAAIGSVTLLSPHLSRLRPLAVTGEVRTPALADVPTLAELNIKSYPSYAWWGVYCPTGTPRPVVDRMLAEITKAVRSPDVTQKFTEQFNMEILLSSPEQFAAFQKSEQERWFKVIKDNHIRGD